MQRIAGGILLVLTASRTAAVGRAQDGPSNPNPPRAPAAVQYRALLAEYDQTSSTAAPRTDAERLEFVGRVFRRRNAVALKLVELADENPDDPIALDALIRAAWQVNTTPWPVELVGEDTARGRALELIERDHIGSDRLGALCRRVSYGFCREYEEFLRAALEKSPHEDIQATACLSLAHFLHGRLQRLDLCREQPALAAEFAGLYGAAYLAQLQRQDRGAAMKEVEARFERAIEQYGDVKLPEGDTVAVRARAELFETRNLSVGRVAPDIEGEDQDGRRFRLSEYRGKVVLLDFWSYS